MHGLECNVYQAAMKRLAVIFREFDNIYVSFSGGKDSSVLLNLALQYARDNGMSHKIGVFHIDYEAQYSATTEFVDRTYRGLGNTVEALRCCVPVKCMTCTSMFEDHWRPWDPDKKALWVRDLPERYLGEETFGFITPEMTDYEFQERFSVWYHEKKQARRTCVLVGLRTEESLDRLRTIISDRNINKYQNHPWTTRIAENVYNAYPIYDWCTDDIWTANARFGWDYNQLYDLFYYAGVPLHLMRVASPFHNAAKSSLGLYRAIDPGTWGRMVSRVNGVNFTATYGGTTVMGWRNISKPAHFTWRQYALFLLDTLPEQIADNYRKKLATSIKFWREKGGVLSVEAQEDLRAAGIPFDVGSLTNYKTAKLPVRMEYADDIDSKDFRLIPTWKRLCVCILKNDHVGQYMGFSQTKAEADKRRAALEKYRDL